ncbi:hypothetical protein RYX45_14275 [Alkalihalophilus pseudofirmus]|uniref:Lipoprotein n=1 Tax=Alkalihalophilus pseudofirmus TaxID=79885 RepID=A0AAJ2NQ04_ALKPS|nr:hypothetical protein [Alkalihalophilus pseudofirmus]MDV2886353.1 hypothetical protein [Alkalihalophilus pseudofirmus]
MKAVLVSIFLALVVLFGCQSTQEAVEEEKVSLGDQHEEPVPEELEAVLNLEDGPLIQPNYDTQSGYSNQDLYEAGCAINPGFFSTSVPIGGNLSKHLEKQEDSYYAQFFYHGVDNEWVYLHMHCYESEDSPELVKVKEAIDLEPFHAYGFDKDEENGPEEDHPFIGKGRYSQTLNEYYTTSHFEWVYENVYYHYEFSSTDHAFDLPVEVIAEDATEVQRSILSYHENPPVLPSYVVHAAGEKGLAQFEEGFIESTHVSTHSESSEFGYESASQYSIYVEPGYSEEELNSLIDKLTDSLLTHIKNNRFVNHDSLNTLEFTIEIIDIDTKDLAYQGILSDQSIEWEEMNPSYNRVPLVVDGEALAKEWIEQLEYNDSTGMYEGELYEAGMIDLTGNGIPEVYAIFHIPVGNIGYVDSKLITFQYKHEWKHMTSKEYTALAVTPLFSHSFSKDERQQLVIGGNEQGSMLAFYFDVIGSLDGESIDFLYQEEYGYGRGGAELEGDVIAVYYDLGKHELRWNGQGFDE